MTRLILASGSIGRKQLLESLKLVFEVRESLVDEEKIQDADPIQLARKRAEAKAEEVMRRIMNHESGIKNKKNHDSKFMILDSVYLIGGDTVGFLGEWVFGKPKSRKEAEEMLRRLSGKTHKYVSAFTMLKFQIPNLKFQIKSKFKISNTFVIPAKAGILESKIPGQARNDRNEKGKDLAMEQWNSGAMEKIIGFDVSSVTFRELTEEDIKFYLDRVEYKKLCGAFKLANSPQNFVTKVEGSISNIIGLPLEKLIPILQSEGMRFI